LVYCVFETAGGEARFGRFLTSEERLRGLLARWRPDRVVAEICPLAAMVHDVACEMGIEVEIADTTQDAWQWRNVKRKTDEDDALKLARLSALGQINRVHIPSLAQADRASCDAGGRADALQESDSRVAGVRGFEVGFG